MRVRKRLGAVLAGILLAGSPCAFALNPALDVSQYAHTSWKYRDGFAKGQIVGIVQTSDGYLWLGTAFGLLRFDGVKTIPWQPPPDQQLPSSYILSLVAARDGTLWIGTRSGLASWKNGKLAQYPELAGLLIYGLLEDREGSIWATVLEVPGAKLCKIQDANIRCTEVDKAAGLHEDAKGNLWVGSTKGVWRWKPASPEFYPVPGTSGGVLHMEDGEDGGLLVPTSGGVRRLAGGKSEMAYPLPVTMRESGAKALLRDRDGGLWIGTPGRGIAHVYKGRADVFAQSDGLSGNDIDGFFEDREGNIWAFTDAGLDRFRELPVITYSTSQGLSRTSGTILATRDGSIWIGTADGLNRLSDGHVTAYRRRSATTRPGVREIASTGLPSQVTSLFQDSAGRVWVSALSAVGYLENDRFISTAAPGGAVDALVEDSSGSIWISNQDAGLFRLSPSNEVQEIPWAAFGRKDPGRRMVGDPSGRGLWLGFFQGGVVYFRDGQVRAAYSPADGLAAGPVHQLRFDKEGALWAAAEHGLSRLKGGRIATLTAKNGLPCDAVQWTMEDDDQSVWMNMPCGLVRIARSELDTWAADQNHTIKNATVFDSSDGVMNESEPGGNGPRVTKSPDGKLWFVTPDGISVVDPRHLPFNKLPPPVQIETVKVNGNPVAAAEGLELSHSSNDLEIDYTALSLTNPDRVRFRYKLEGKDADWQEAGTRRYAPYGGLAPKKYRFRVMASNNDGVWNEAGAILNFSIVPAYYQTSWFLGLEVLAGAGFLWLAYRLRLRQVAQRLNLRMEERVNERTRIARDLHDTLLQSFQGVLLKFHAVTFMLPDRPTEAQETLETVIEQARRAIAEGRDAVQGLRSSAAVPGDLAGVIGTVGQELAAGENAPGFRVQVEGMPRDLVPLVRDETYRIACEAVRNAFRHAQAGQIEVEIRYDPRQLRLRVRDDGKGMDPKILAEGGRSGHHGLPGMHERARLVGGKLAVWSKLDSGTEAELTIPASVAYTKGT